MSATSASGAHEGGTEHEFTEAENEVLQGFVSAAVGWGVLCALGGLACVALLVVRLLAGHGHGAMGLLLGLGGLVQLSLAVSFIGAGRAFLAAVRTSGSDIHHAMTALRFLSRAFLVQIGFAAVSIGVAVLAGSGALR